MANKTPEQIPEKEYENQSSVKPSIGVDLEKWFLRLKVLVLFQNDPEISSKLPQLMDSSSSVNELKRIIEDETIQQSDKSKKLGEMFKVSNDWQAKSTKARSESLVEILTDGQKKTLGMDDAAIKLFEKKLTKVTPTNKSDLESTLGQIEKLLDGGVDRYKTPENFFVLERQMERLKAEIEMFHLKTEMGKEIAGDNAGFAALKPIIDDSNPDRLLQVRNGDKKLEATLKKVVDQVKILEGDPSKWDNLTDEQILEYWENIVELQVKQRGGLDAGKLKISKEHDQRAETAFVLEMLNLNFREKLAERMIAKWKNAEPSKRWEVVGKAALDQALNDKHVRSSRKYLLKGKDSKEKYDDLFTQARLKAKKSLDISGDVRGSGSVSNNAERLQEDIKREMIEKSWNEMYGEVSAFITNDGYNIFEDVDFSKDIIDARGGIDRIVARAINNGLATKDKVKFKKVIEGIRDGILRSPDGGVDGDPMRQFDAQLWKGLQNKMLTEDYGAAGNILLDYFGKAKIPETTQDMSMLYILRWFSIKAGRANPDYAALWGNQRKMNYIPGINGISPDEYKKIGLALADKSMVDCMLGDKGLMGGVKAKYRIGNQEKEFVLTPAKMFALLQDRQAQVDILNCNVNSTDTTLWKILLREMYGGDTLIEPGEMTAEGIPRDMFVTLPGGEKQSIKDIKLNVCYADFDAIGFKGWKEKNTEKINLFEYLDNHTWSMNAGLQYMWYTGRWMDTVKSYPKLVMQNSPKSLASTIGAMMPDYKLEYEVFDPWFIEDAHLFDNLLGTAERYKRKDMITGYISDELFKNIGSGIINIPAEQGVNVGGNRVIKAEKAREELKSRTNKIAEFFNRVMFIPNKAKIGGKEVEFEGIQISRDMFRLIGNDLKTDRAGDNNQVIDLVKKSMIQRGFLKSDLPSNEKILGYYTEYLDRKSKGTLDLEKSEEKRIGGLAVDMANEHNKHINTIVAWGAQVDGMWGTVKHLQYKKYLKNDGSLDFYEKDLINSLTEEEWNIFAQMNKKISGLDQEINAQNYTQVLEPESLICRTTTSHGDDPLSFWSKYFDSDQEARKALNKIFTFMIENKDFEDIAKAMSAYLDPKKLRLVMQELQTRQNEGSTYGIYRTAARLATGGTNDIAWATLKDSRGNEIVATDMHGSRVYHETSFVGRYDQKVKGMDYHRPSAHKAVATHLQFRGYYDSESMEHVLERVLGTRGFLDMVKTRAQQWAKRNGRPFDETKWEEWVDKNSHWSSKVWAKAKELFLFEDPKYAMWTLAAEYWGLTDKTFEQIFGMSILGGGGGGHKGH